jgi:hypothetical protein
MDDLSDLIDAGDIDELCSAVDGLALDESWDDIVVLRDRSRLAIDRGRQLWPAAAWAEYRLCLDAPARYGASLVDSSASRFTLGPFAEVLASTHEWRELAEHLPATPGGDATVMERVVRGDDLRADERASGIAANGGVPAFLLPWEPVYPVATYHLDRVEWPLPIALLQRPFAARPRDISPGRNIADDDTRRALTESVRHWTTESNGSVRASAVEGDMAEALGSLGFDTVRMMDVNAQDAMTLIAWAAGGGGAHGRRRGASVGRFEAWWVAAHVAGVADDWPITPEDLHDALSDVRWAVWAPVDARQPEEGVDGSWVLRIAAEVPGEGLAWALDATDVASS